MADVESSFEDAVDVSMEDNVAGKEVAVRPFNPQTYKREQIRLSSSQVDEVQNPLRALSEKHEDDLLGSLRAKKYHHDAGLKPVARPLSGKLGAVRVNIKVESRGRKRFFKEGFSLNVFGSPFSRPCVQKHAISG